MKKSLIIATAVGILLLVGGYFFYSSFLNEDNLLKRIPREPAWVATLRIKTLADKLDMDRVRQLGMWRNMNRSFQSRLNPEEQAYMDKLSSDPTFSGINLFQGLYAFGEWRESRMITGIVFGVLSATKLEEFILQAPGPTRIQIREQEGCLILEDKDILLIWDDDSGIALFGGRDLVDYGLGLMQLNKDQSILDNKAFQASNMSDHDIALFATYDGIARGAKRNLREMGSTFDLYGTNLMMSLDFNESNIDLQAVLSDRQGIPFTNTILTDKGVSDELISMTLEDKTLGFASMSINSEKIFQWARLLPDYDRISRKMARDLDCTVNDLEQIFGGEVIAGFSGMRKYGSDSNEAEDWSAATKTEEPPLDTAAEVTVYDAEVTETTEQVEDTEASVAALPDGEEYNPFWYDDDLTSSPYPEFTISIGLNRPEVFRSLMLRDGKKPVKENYWRFIDKGVAYHLILNDHGITITTGQQAANALVSNGRLESRAAERIRDLASTAPLSAYLSINPDDYMQEFFSSGSRRKQMFDINTMLKELDYLELSTSGARSRFAIHFKPGDGNTLFRLFAIADRLAPTL
jgi:hypothetical protein